MTTMTTVLLQTIEVNNPKPIVSHAIENVKTVAEAQLKIKAARRGTYGLVVLHDAPLPFNQDFQALKKLCVEFGICLAIAQPK
jgi:hypothetical protein